LARKSDVFVNVYPYDPWWVRWLTMLHWLLKVQLTFGGTRGFRRRNSAVTIFADVKGLKRDSRNIADDIAAAVAEVLVREGVDRNDIGGYLILRDGSRTHPIRTPARSSRNA
jgi:hypothetical protein